MKAVLTFLELPESLLQYNERIQVIVSVYVMDNGEMSFRNSAELWLNLTNSYEDIFPKLLNEGEPIGYGENVIVKPELRSYPADTEEGYKLLEGFSCRWYYDPNCIVITDENGEPAGNNDDEDMYIGETDSSFYTIRRIGDWDTDITLAIDYKDSNENEQHLEHWYHVDRLQYEIRTNAPMDWVYSDGELDITYGISDAVSACVERGEGNLVITIGIPDFDSGDPMQNGFQWKVICAEGRDYSINDNMITLHGAALYDTVGEQPIYVNIRLDSSDGRTIFWPGDCQINVYEEWENSNRKGDRDMLPGWDDSISRFFDVSLGNGEFPYGWNGSYEVVDVQIISQTPAVPGKIVAEVRRDVNQNDENDYWWYYRVYNHGEAVFEVTYLDYHGEKKTYTFNICVNGDVYNLEADYALGANVGLPGATIPFWAQGYHHIEGQPDETEGLIYEWTLTEFGDQIGYITVDPEDSRKASITFYDELSREYDGQWFPVRVTLYDGVDEAGNRIERSWQDLWVMMAHDYYDIAPSLIDPNLLVGNSVTETFELRRLSSDMETGTYEVCENVHFRWYYDSNALEIRDASGRIVGNNDEEGYYIDSEESYGTSVSFTIKRKEPWGTDINLMVDYGAEQQTGFVYTLYHQDYSIWLNTDKDTNNVYTDGQLYINYDLSGQLQAMKDAGACTIEVTVGIPDDELPENAWVKDFSGETYYRVEENVISLNGAALFEALKEYDTDRIRVEVKAVNGEMELSRNFRDVWVREIKEDMDREWSRGMLPGWDGNVQKYYNVYVENTEYPFGENLQYRVINVEIENTWGGSEEEASVWLERMQDETDPDNYWWYYRADTYGGATLKVTYETPSGGTDSYVFDLYVNGDVFDLNLWTEDGSDRSLPGTVKVLQAELWHHSDHGDNSTDGITLEWSIQDEYQAQFADLILDPDNPTRAELQFHDIPEGQDWIWEDIWVDVVAYNGIDEDGNPLECCRRDIRITVASQYNEIWPTRTDSDLDMGCSEKISVEVRRYPSLSEQEYDLEADVFYRWEYDENAVEVLDEEGNKVGNYNENGYIGSAASTGTIVDFTIHRLTSWGTNLVIYAEWTDAYGEEHQERRDYWLNQKNYNIWFEQDHMDVYTDCETVLELNIDELGSLDYQLEVTAGWVDEEDRFISYLPKSGCRVEGNRVIISGDKLGNYQYDSICVLARVLYQNEELSCTWGWVNIIKACNEHSWLTRVVQKPTCSEPGMEKWVCDECGEVRFIETDRLEHQTTIVNAKEATEEEEGYTGDLVCTVCGELLVEGTVIPKKVVLVMGITLNAEEIILPALETFQLEATILTASLVTNQMVVWSTDNEAIASVDNHGLVTAKTYGTATITASVERSPGETVSASCLVHVLFSDVLKGYYYTPVYWAADLGITRGYNGGEYFGVGANCTRQDLMIFLWRAEGQPTGYGDARNMFNDVTKGPNTAANQAIAWGYSTGIVKGYKDGGFHPNDPIVRKDVMIMLYRVAGKPAVSGTVTFTDVIENGYKTTSDTYRAILWGVQQGITKGYSEGPLAGQFGCTENCLREQIVTFLYRYKN